MTTDPFDILSNIEMMGLRDAGGEEFNGTLVSFMLLCTVIGILGSMFSFLRGCLHLIMYSAPGKKAEAKEDIANTLAFIVLLGGFTFFLEVILSLANSFV